MVLDDIGLVEDGIDSDSASNCKFEKIRLLEDAMNQNQPFRKYWILEATFRCWMSLARVSIHILGASAIMAVCTFCS